MIECELTSKDVALIIESIDRSLQLPYGGREDDLLKLRAEMCYILVNHLKYQ